MIKVIRGARVLDIEGYRAAFADVLIDGDTISEVGAPGMAVPDCEEIDAAGRLLIPGLINAHTHGQNNLGKGLADRWNLELLINAAPWTTGGRTLEDKYLSTQLAAVEMIRKGCTAAYDLSLEFPAPTREGVEAVGRAYTDVGLRAVVAPMISDKSLYEAIPGLMDALPPDLQQAVERFRLAPREVSLQAMETSLKTWPFDRDQIRLAVAPTIPHHCTEELWIGLRDLAREYGTGLHTHLSESKVQAIMALKIYGMSQTAYLDQLGVLGPDFTAAHAIWLDDDDMRRLGDAGASIAHNAGSNGRLGGGLAAIRRMVERGVNVGIGTDGCTCSDNLNMFEAMRIASLYSRLQDVDYTRWLSAGEVLTMATQGSARALGFGDSIGALRPGYKADIVFLDLARINYVPLNSPTIQVVNAEDGTGVDSVMIGGRIVLDRGHMTTVDEDKLVRDAENAIERLMGPESGPTKELVFRLAEVVGPFSVAVARETHPIERHAPGGG